MRDRLSILRALAALMWEQKAWWMFPIVAVLLLTIGLTLLSSASPLAPLLYPLF